MRWKRMFSRFLLALIWLSLVPFRLSSGQDSSTNQKRTVSFASFQNVVLVLESPRCVNCHTDLDAPLQGDNGLLHSMNVKRGLDGRGTPAMRCANCHQSSNSNLEHGPPGVSGWRLPPAGEPMAWKGVSARIVCQNLKNPSDNGNRDLSALLQHVTNDPLVRWGWAPGPGRTLPPLSHAEFVQQFRKWIESGAYCSE